MDHIVHRVLRFDRFVLDLTRGCLRVDDQDIDLRPKAFEVLCYLATNAGRLVPKQELCDAVWPNVTVSDNSLVQCIRELRHKLGDNHHRLIKTMSRRGYLLDVAVSAQEQQSFSDESAATPVEGPARPATRLDVLHRALSAIAANKSRMWGAAAAGLMCVVLGIIYLIGPPLPITNPGHVSLAEDVAAEQYSRSTFRDCGNCPEMVTLPPGEFMMGSVRPDIGAELPKIVIIKKPIAIGKFEVTVDQFAAFVAETGTSAGTSCRAIVGENGRFIVGPPEVSFRSPGFAVTGAHPAVCINWHDAHEYVEWLRRRTGKSYRLPTDVEWEYAARAGTQTYYSFGDDVVALCDYGRFANQETPFPWRNGCSSDTASTIPVGQLKPNPWGIFDMHGNAFEWVEDCSDPPSNPFSLPGGCVDARIVRGGSWANNSWVLGSPVRRLMSLTFRRNHVGFRVALSLGE